MIPVGECKNQLLVVLIGIRRFWVVNNKRTAEAVWVLPVDMGMVPVSARLVNLNMSAANICSTRTWTYSEIISERRTRRNTTLSNANNSVHLVRAIHEKAVKVQRSALITEVIVQVDDDSVADSGFYARNWPLSVDTHDRSRVEAIRVSKDPAYIEVGGAQLGRCRTQ
jgi:hypothetical protein